MKCIHSQPATPTATTPVRHPLSAIGHLSVLVLSLLIAAPASADFSADLRALTAAPHRLAGSPEGRAAADYIEQRLRKIGITEIYPLEFPLWQVKTREAALEIGGRTIRLKPLHPNVVVPPSTGPEGLTRPLIYAGQGRIEDYGSRAADGRIVALDYDCGDNWETAFALGADAVIFLGKGDETPTQTKQASVPVNQLRFYVSAADFAGIDLGAVHENATIKSAVTWEQSLGRNILARVPGTQADFADGRTEPEAMVLAAHFDTMGAVPELSPGARGAANVAALLEAADRFHKDPPKRDVLFMFVDNQSRSHQGTREAYDALNMTPAVHDRLAGEHKDELGFVQRMKELLATAGLHFRGAESLSKPEEGEQAGSAPAALARALRSEANYRRDDLAKAVQVLRLRARAFGGAAQAQAEAEGIARDDEIFRWDAIRRELHHGRLSDFVTMQEARAQGRLDDEEAKNANPEKQAELIAEAKLYLPMFDALVQQTLARFDRRLGELNTLIRIDEQRAALRAAMQDRFVVLHATYNLSGGGAEWAVVVGDRTDALWAKNNRRPKPEGDTPGYYTRVLGAFRDTIADINTGKPEAEQLAVEKRSLTDPTLGTTLAPGPFFSSGYVAGVYGIYNVSVMTAYDARLRDGHPADTLDHLDADAFRAQADEATSVLLRLGDSQLLSLPRVFKSFVRSKYPGWNGSKATGDAYVGLQVSGSLSEDRPAAGAMLASWPGPKRNPPISEAWQWMGNALLSPAFQPTLLQVVDANGRFSVVGYQSEMQLEIMTLGAMFDGRGQAVATSNRQTQAQKSNEAMRIDLMTGTGYGFTISPIYSLKANQLKILRAAADAEFRLTRGLWGQDGANGFFFISDYTIEDRAKLFQPMGPVVLGADNDARSEGFGGGVDIRSFTFAPYLTPQTASDLWRLNENRLAALRSRGVTSADLELLHSRAKRLLDEGENPAAPLQSREASLQRSSVLSHRVYQPLRAAMDDLVHAIVVLLLLAIPFAFALERLIVCSTTIYGRIAGFTVFFLLTFGVLYFTHPGFSIASTPVIIFLAFAIILLSSLVIYIVFRKFQTELKAMQGQAGGVHDSNVSHTATLLAAVGMGMSTMRRRPTRTFLTATTVVALTFTILCFASFSRVVGVRSIAVGLKNDATAPGLLLRKLDYSTIPQGVLTLLSGVEGKAGLVAPHWWLTRSAADTPPYTVTRLDDGRSVELQAVMGVPVPELPRWPQLTESLGAAPPPADATAEQKAAWQTSLQPLEKSLNDGDVYLPPIVQELLDLEVGQQVLLSGVRVRFAGVINATALQRLKHLDGESIIPVDFQTAGLEASSSAAAPSMEDELLMADDVEKDFVHLSADQVAVTSAERVRAMGGEPNLISIYPGVTDAGEKIDPAKLGKDVAPVVVMPVWAAGVEGVERMLLTVLTEVSGGLALFVPLLLGGLIIFGTLLGSIQDREKEIYTFSALGLSPGHVGILFFAEATVYAVVGGMGGQLLAQFVALSAAALAKAGYISPANINYSSTNALFAIGVVMATVIISAIYPAIRASKSANPGLARAWKMPAAIEDTIKLTFPFTVSAYDITGVVSFLAEHFRRHDDAGLGSFAASNVKIGRNAEGNLTLEADLALAPFDLGVTQHMVLTAIPSEIEGVDEVAIQVDRSSGARGDWYRANKVFMRDLRRQFLLWRTLSGEMIEHYRMETLETLGETRRRDLPPPTPAEGPFGPMPSPA